MLIKPTFAVLVEHTSLHLFMLTHHGSVVVNIGTVENFTSVDLVFVTKSVMIDIFICPVQWSLRTPRVIAAGSLHFEFTVFDL